MSMETIKAVGPNLKSFFYYVTKPEEESLVRGSVLLLHGSEEYGGRYGAFGEELAKNGYALYAIDHVGHGNTAMGDKKNVGKWKKVGKKNDFHSSAYNAYYLADVIRKNHPGKPVYLLGHDFGGTMAQYMLGQFPDAFDGIIISGCGVPTGRDKFIFLKSFIKKICLYDEMKSKGTFKSRKKYMNMHFRPNRTKYDWLNSQPEEVDRFIEDKFSGFVAEIGYYYYLYRYIVLTPTFVRFKKINKELPIMFIGGEDDYMIHRGKTMQKLLKFYNRKGFVKTDIKMYSGARHDILMEWNKDVVAEDIADWINRNTYKEEVVDKPYVESKPEVKAITLGSMVENKPEVVNNFLEEEPEDELRLSTKLKK